MACAKRPLTKVSKPRSPLAFEATHDESPIFSATKKVFGIMLAFFGKSNRIFQRLFAYSVVAVHRAASSYPECRVTMRASNSARVAGDFAFLIPGRFNAPASNAAITASCTYEVRQTLGVLANSSATSITASRT